MSIVISRALGLAAELDLDITTDNPLIGWANLVTTANLAADGAAEGYPVTNLANPSTADGASWKGATTDAQDLTLTVPEGEAIDYVGIARHNFATAGVTVAIDVKTEIGDDWTEVVAEFLPGDDDPILARFTAQLPGFLRIRLGAGTAAPQVAVVHVGQVLVLARRLYVGHAPISHAVREQVVTATSQGGQFLGAVVTGKTLETAIEIANLDPAWFRANLAPFVAAGRSAAFFWAWRPATYAREVAYCWRTGDVRAVNQRSNGMMQVSIPIAGTVT